MGVNETLAKPGDRGAALLAAIYAHPDDDAARMVYADYLQDQGDPRGELIALQLANAQPERQAALLEEHAPRWLGGLATQIKRTGLVWERGFVVAGEALPTEEPPDPAWRLVHTLIGTTPLHDAHPMPSLRTLTVDNVQPLTRLTAPLAVERLVYTGPVRPRFAKVTCLPALAHLSLRSLDAQTPMDYTEMLKRKGLASVHAIVDLLALGVWSTLEVPEITLEEPGAHAWRVRLTKRGKKASRKHDVVLIAPRLQPSQAWLQQQHRPWGDAMLAGLALLAHDGIASVAVETTAAAMGPIQKLFADQLARLYGDVAWTTMRA